MSSLTDHEENSQTSLIPQAQLTRKQRQKAKRQVRREAERQQGRKRTGYLRSLSMCDLMVRCGAKTGNGVIMLSGDRMSPDQHKLFDDWLDAFKLVEVSPGRWDLPGLNRQGGKS